MLSIQFQSNISRWTQFMGSARRQVPFATARALTKVAQQIVDDERDDLNSIFDRPTRYTRNSLVSKGANKRNLRAEIYFKDSSRHRRHYLLPQVEGGGRPHKRFEAWLISRGIMESDEYAVPAAGVRLNKFGNISQSTIGQILTQLNASPDGMQWETARSRKRAGPKRFRYFVPKPGSRLSRGIWRRVGKRKISPILLFVRAPRYDARYGFHNRMYRKAERLFPPIFLRELKHAIETAR